MKFHTFDIKAGTVVEMHKLWSNWNAQYWLISRYLEDCTPRLMSEQSNSVTYFARLVTVTLRNNKQM